MSNVELQEWVKHDYGQIYCVTDIMQSLHCRRLDQRRIDNKLSLMYKITHNLIAIPISIKTLSTLSPVVLQADNCYDWLLQLFILSKSCISLEQPFAQNCGLPNLGTVQPISLQDWPRLTIETHHTFTFKPNLYSYLFYLFLVVVYWLHPPFFIFSFTNIPAAWRAYV